MIMRKKPRAWSPRVKEYGFEMCRNHKQQSLRIGE